MKLGYACINMELRESKPSVHTNRRMIRKTFLTKGLTYASELALQNSIDLLTILKWNVAHNIGLFRMSSGIFPWSSEYKLERLPDFSKIEYHLKKAGDYAKQHNLRITSHPDHFVKLASPNEKTLMASIVELSQHAQVFDMMELSQTVYNKINIHIGGVYGDKKATAERFCKNFELLPYNVRSRLTVENDDKQVGYSTLDLYKLVYSKINIPIVFDYHHHQFNTGGLSTSQAFSLAYNTWPIDIVPVFHYSESNENSNNPRAHSDYIVNHIDTFGMNIDIMVEAKMKERAVLEYTQAVDF